MKIKKHLMLALLLLLANSSWAQLKWLKVSAGAEFAFALRSDSTIWSWGFNGNGQLGNGNTITNSLPAQIGTDKDWVDITAGAMSGFGIKANGTLWAWGFNNIGTLGDGTITQRLQPVQIGNDNNWLTIECGQAHTLAIKTDHTLWSWGFNYTGQLGLGDTVNRHVPTLVDTSHQWVAIAAGGYHSLALKLNGTLWAWGSNANGQLGDTLAAISTLSYYPVQIDVATDWKSISAGFQYSLAMKNNNSLWAWGFNGNGQVGDGTNVEKKLPVQIGNGQSWKSIAAGGASAYALNVHNVLYSWGYDGYGQLGNGGSGQQNTPTITDVDSSWKSIAASDGLFYNSSVFGLSCYGLKTNADIICTAGANYIGQLGDGTTSSEDVFNCATGSLMVGIADLDNEKGNISIYPNPTSDKISIKGIEQPSIVIVNLMGQKLVTSHGSNELSLAHLPAGLYLVQVFNKDMELVKSEKVIKE